VFVQAGMTGLKVPCACILIILIVSASGAASGEARKLLKVADPGGKKVCASPGCHATLPATTKMATVDGRPTAHGHSPGIGNKMSGNTRWSKALKNHHGRRPPTVSSSISSFGSLGLDSKNASIKKEKRQEKWLVVDDAVHFLLLSFGCTPIFKILLSFTF
jgi:hypothetical protein